MKYFLEYLKQVQSFYKVMNNNLFARERNLDGRLVDYVMKPGFFWELVTIHKWLAYSVWHLFKTVVQLVVAYLAAVIITVIYLLTPVLLVLFFPIFTAIHYKRIKAQGERL